MSDNKNKVCGEILNDQYEMFSLVAEQQDLNVPVSKRSFKNLTNKEKAFMNTCLAGSVIDYFIKDYKQQQEKHKRAMNTLMELVRKCETTEQLKMLQEMPLFKEWHDKVKDAGTLDDSDDECDCPDCSPTGNPIIDTLLSD